MPGPRAKYKLSNATIVALKQLRNSGNYSDAYRVIYSDLKKNPLVDHDTLTWYRNAIEINDPKSVAYNHYFARSYVRIALQREGKYIRYSYQAFDAIFQAASNKWAKLAKCSQDTAARDIEDLVRKGMLQRSIAGGRSTSYDIVAPTER